MIAIVAAPSNLGLRPPQPGSVPGCAKAPEALREAGLHQRMLEAGAAEFGVVLPGRYADDADPGARRLRNQGAILDHAHRLAARITDLLAQRRTPLVLGGDCSLLIGAGLALARAGRWGLVHLDGHTDFRHPGNSQDCASLAGEDLAAAVGVHWPEVADIEDLGPYFASEDAVHLGCRDDDEHLEEVRARLGEVIAASEITRAGCAAAARRALDVVRRGGPQRRSVPGGDRARLNGYWLHLDVDVLDPSHLSAVDSPDPGGLDPEQLTELLTLIAPGAIGAQVTVFDPDLDPTGDQARLLTEILHVGLRDLGTAAT